MIGYIYRITNIKTNKCYIGITSDFKRRKKKHLTELKTNVHHSLKLQNAWNYWGESNFEWTVREVELEKYEDLYFLEIEEIKKYDSYNNGYNCTTGGFVSDWKQKAKDEDIIKFLCIQYKYGDGYGKTCEQVFGWAKGTASSAKRKIRFFNANSAFEKLSNEEKEKIAIKTFEEYNLLKIALQRQLTQGGCERVYQLNQSDFNFAFCAQELGYTYKTVAEYLGVKPLTVKDWFNKRSRKKEREKYEKLTIEEKKSNNWLC